MSCEEAMTAIEVKNVTKTYRLYHSPKDRLRELVSLSGKKYHHEFHALRDVSLTIEKGETVGIIGQNGSGKSTLLKIICGVVKPTQGSVTVNGRISSLLELGAGFHPEFTGRDNVYMNGALMGLSREEIDKRFPKIEAFAEIGEFIDQPVKTYSSGMFVRLAFATAINVDPEVLVVDEALAVGDMRFQLKCIEALKSFREARRTILFVTHNIYVVRNLCHQALWLDQGEIKGFGEVLPVSDAYTDFMRSEDAGIRALHPSCDKTREALVSIRDVRVADSNLRETHSVGVGDCFAVKVSYRLHSECEGLVGGVAIFRNDDTYVCGVNTKLDNVTLPSKPGDYELLVRYRASPLLPGTYYLHVGFFEREAVVQLDFKSRTKSFSVYAKDYRAEGVCLLDHAWEVVCL